MVYTARTTSHWVLVAALGLALAGQVHAEPEEKANPRGAEERAKPLEPAKQTVTLKTPIDRPSIYKRECGRPRDAQEDSLCVSVQAAIAAEKSTDLANAQVRIAWLQALGLLISLVFTGWAARAAAAAAKAAKSSVEDARADAADQADRFERQFEIAKRSADASQRHAASFEEGMRIVDRAYVFGGIGEIGATEDGWRIAISVANYGKTPARIRNITFGIHDAIYGLERFPKNREYSGSSVYETDTIFPGGVSEPSVVVLTNSPMSGILYGFISYADIFNIEHVSRFCMFYDASVPVCRTHGTATWNEYD